jgi:flagellar biosynthetic protein FliQ
LLVSAKLAGPFLIVVLAVGVVIGLLQSVTQLQEQTLTFVPKLIGSAIVIAVSGNWMLASLVEFSRELMNSVPALLRG